MKLRFISTLLSVFFVAGAANAVKLSNTGVGEVFITPYYTVQGGNETLIGITNMSAETKAVKIHFREAQNGKRVQSFNLYLQPNDVWSGKVALNNDGKTVLLSKDRSCTAPNVYSMGDQGLAFYSSIYSGDGGDEGPGRTREGFVELVEMGVVEAAEHTAAVIPDVDGKCGIDTGYWDTDGKWTTNPLDGMGPLSGGLFAEANIIDVEGGVEYSQTLTMLEEFNNTGESLHTAPGFDQPSLNSAYPNESKMPDDVWATRVDAVSGLLMSQRLANSFTLNPNVQATSEWIVTFPTKRFYTDFETARQPFTNVFGANGACENVGVSYWNRETMESEAGGSVDLCYVANSVRLKGPGADSNIFQAVWSGVDIELAGGSFPNGWLEMDFVKLAADAQQPPQASDYIDHIMESGGGSIYAGLPVIGFGVSRLANANVGVGAAYAANAPHKTIPSVGYSQIDPSCVEPGSVCKDLGTITANATYDHRILAGERHVYHLRMPKFDPNSDTPNLQALFQVIDHGASAFLKLGLSKVKGRTSPGDGEASACFKGPRIQLTLVAATDDTYTDCVVEFDADYYFTIESLEAENPGDYRFQFGQLAPY